MKNIYILLIMIISLTNCQLVDVLDQDPMYRLDLEGAITTPDMAELALTGTYRYLPSTGMNYIYPVFSGSFMGGTMVRQDFITGTVNAIYFAERFLNVLSYSTFGNGEWENCYNIIKNANFLLTALDGIGESDFATGRKAEMIGECHFLIAFAYYRLLRQFGEYWDPASQYGLLIRNELPAVSNAVKARANVADSYTEIFTHLNIALTQAPDYTVSTRGSKQAARALRAEVLFLQGEYAEAAVAAEEAISAVNPLEDSYADVFAKAESSKEIIFSRGFGTEEASGVSYYLEAACGDGYWGPTESYMELIAGDPRESVVVGQTDVTWRENTYPNRNVVKKLYRGDGVAMPTLFMRTAELYLIQAEALARSNASIADAWSPILALRIRAGSSDLTQPATRDALMEEIFKEWLVEMSFENWHEWFAVQRFDKLFVMNQSLAQQLADEEEDGDPEAFRQRIKWRRIYNIPTNETSANSACLPNPGY